MVENLLSLVGGGGDGFVAAHEGFAPILSRYLFIACIALVWLLEEAIVLNLWGPATGSRCIGPGLSLVFKISPPLINIL